MIGTYLYPYSIFGQPDYAESYSTLEIIERVATSSAEVPEVLITRNGGLFVRPPGSYPLPAKADVAAIHKKIGFEDKTAGVFNLVICEFALHGVVSEPATAVHISAGKLINDHALITSAAGGRETYYERSIQPAIQLIKGTWHMSRVHSAELLTKVAPLRLTRRSYHYCREYSDVDSRFVFTLLPPTAC